MTRIGELEFSIRDCTQSDYNWCYILSEENMKPYVEKHWRNWDSKFFTDNFKIERTKIIEIENIAIGFYEIEFQDRLGIVHGVQIVPEYKNRGIGTKIMELIETEFKAYGIETSRLIVFTDNPARNLYARLGYREISEQNAYAKKGTVVMEKRMGGK